MDYEQAVTYVFKDKDWIAKIAVGGLMSLFGFLIVPVLFVNGYYIRTIRWVKDGNTDSLPEWDDWADLLATGFRYWVTTLIYTLPFVLISGFLYLLVFGLPILLPAIGGKGNDSLAAAIAIFSVVGMFIFEGLVMVMSILMLFWLPVVAIRFAATDSIKACLDFGELYRFIKTNFSKYILVILILWAFGYLASLGFILCCVGLFFTVFYAQLVGAHLKGQLANLSGWAKEEQQA